MAHEKVHVICENLCLEEGMTKEQIKEQTLFYFNNVAAMKASNHLKEGMSVKTLGYYSANDGGGATYLVRTKTDEDVEDDGLIHFIGDNLVTELILDEPKKINVLQMGVKRNVDEDQSTKVQNILGLPMKYDIYFPSGRYYFEHTLTNNKRHNILGACNTATDLDRQINGTRLYFTDIADSGILLDCQNGSRCSIRDIYIICDNVEITLDKSLMSNGTTPKDIFTTTKKGEGIVGIRLGDFGNQLKNVTVYGCNKGISFHTYNVLDNVSCVCCELAMYGNNDNVLTNINIQRCEEGIELNGGLNNLSQVRLDSIRTYGLTIKSGANANNITNFIADICQYASIRIGNAKYNCISGVVGRSGTYYANFEPNDNIDATKACKVLLYSSSQDNKIDIIAYRGNALDNPNDMRYISTYEVVANDNSINNNVSITGQPFAETINENTLLSVEQLSRLYHRNSGNYSGNVTFQGMTYIINNTSNLSKYNIYVQKPVRYDETPAIFTESGSLDMNGKTINNVGELRLGDSTNGWAYLTRSSNQGNLKVGNLSTSYSRTDAQITGVANPTTTTSAANKSYVDNK